MRIPIVSSVAFVIAAGLGLSSAHGQSEPQFSAQFTSTAGWTSNAGNDAFELESLFSSQTGLVSGTVRGDNFVLRGSIGGTQTQYFNAPLEDDRSAEADLVLDYQFAPQTQLRGSLHLGINDTGSALSIGGDLYAMRTISGETQADITLAHGWDQWQVALDFGHGQTRIGPSRTPDLPFAPERLEPDRLLTTVGLRSAYKVDDGFALLADAGLRHLGIPAQDQATFGRLPVTALRLAAGVQAGMAGTQFLARGGADFLFGGATVGEVLVLPYAEIEGSWAANDSFGLEASASAQTYLSSPTDGIADWALALSTGANWLPVAGTALNAGVFVKRDYQSDGQTEIETRRGMHLGATQRLGGNVELGANLRLSDTQYAGGSFRNTRIGIDLNAVI